MITDALSGARRVRRRARERVEQPQLARLLHAPPTFMNHLVSPARTFATATLSMGQVKQTSKRLRITINDMVMSMVAGALRELMLRYDGDAEQPIIASVPASTDRSPNRISGNELGGMVVSLPTHIGDPLERVRLASLATGIAKENNELFGPELYGRLITYLPPFVAPPAFRWLARRDARNRLFNVPVSNVAGPRTRGHLAGVPVSEIYSAGPLIAGCGINITVWSYVDQLNVSVIADDCTLNDVHEVTDAVVHAFGEIRSAAGFSDTPAKVDSAMP
jgi:WS/DGAT/MGAT family acyltransferase